MEVADGVRLLPRWISAVHTIKLPSADAVKGDGALGGSGAGFFFGDFLNSVCTSTIS